jgi:hypothetical protein
MSPDHIKVKRSGPDGFPFVVSDKTEVPFKGSGTRGGLRRDFQVEKKVELLWVGEL